MDNFSEKIQNMRHRSSDVRLKGWGGSLALFQCSCFSCRERNRSYKKNIRKKNDKEKPVLPGNMVTGKCHFLKLMYGLSYLPLLLMELWGIPRQRLTCLPEITGLNPMRHSQRRSFAWGRKTQYLYAMFLEASLRVSLVSPCNM